MELCARRDMYTGEGVVLICDWMQPQRVYYLFRGRRAVGADAPFRAITAPPPRIVSKLIL